MRGVTGLLVSGEVGGWALRGITGLPLPGRLQVPPGAGGAILHRAAGLQPEGAARVHLAAKPALPHRGAVCPPGRGPAEEEVSFPECGLLVMG